jgi:arsenate reductase-like glutaredoxin family protein
MSRFAPRTHFEAGRVYLEDVRSNRCWYCKDLIKWFDKNGLDYKAFRNHGIPFAELAATNDALAMAAIASAKQREAGN